MWVLFHLNFIDFKNLFELTNMQTTHLQKLVKLLVGPLWGCVLRQVQELMAEMDIIEPRTNLDYFNRFLHYDLQEDYLKTYNMEEIFTILWADYKKSNAYKYQFRALNALVPTLTHEIFENGLKRLYSLNRNELTENDIFIQDGNNYIYNSQIQLLPPYNFYLEWLQMPLEEEARNLRKREIYADFERHLKQLKQVELLVKYYPDAVRRYISKYNLPENEIEKFHTELDKLIILSGVGVWPEPLRAELREVESQSDEADLSEHQSRQLHTGVEIGAPTGFFGKLASGGGGWIGLLFILLLVAEMLRQYFKNPSKNLK